MVNIVLVCAGGLSTSLMVNKMKTAAKKMTLDCNIAAMSADEFTDEEYEADILLIAPQLAWREEEIRDESSERVKVIQCINKTDYGMMNGEKVLNLAMQEYNK